MSFEIKLDDDFDYWNDNTNKNHIYKYDIGKKDDKTVDNDNNIRVYTYGDKQISEKYQNQIIIFKKNELKEKLTKNILTETNFKKLKFRLYEKNYDEIYFEYLLYTIFKDICLPHYFKGNEYNKLLYNIVNKNYYKTKANEKSRYDEFLNDDDDKYLVTKEFNFVVDFDEMSSEKVYKGYLYTNHIEAEAEAKEAKEAKEALAALAKAAALAEAAALAKAALAEAAAEATAEATEEAKAAKAVKAEEAEAKAALAAVAAVAAVKAIEADAVAAVKAIEADADAVTEEAKAATKAAEAVKAEAEKAKAATKAAEAEKKAKAAKYKLEKLNYITNNFNNIINCLIKNNKINNDGKIIDFIGIDKCIEKEIESLEPPKSEPTKLEKIEYLLAANKQLNPDKPPISNPQEGGSSFPRIASLLAASQINMPPLLSPISSFYEKYIKYKSKYLKLQKIKSLKY